MQPMVSSLQPSNYKDLLQNSIKNQYLILGNLVHSHMIRISYKPGLFIHNNLLNIFLKPSDINSALQLFDRMPTRDITTYNCLMSGCFHLGLSNKAMQVFSNARRHKIALDKFSYAGALSVCAETGDLRRGRIAHALIVVSGLACRAFLTNSLIDMYSKCGKIDEVRLVFDRADELDEISWNSLLSAYVRIGWPEVVVDVLVWMHRNGVKLNTFALGSVLQACSGCSDSLELQRMLHGCVVKVGLDLDCFVGSAMLDMYAKNGGLDEAIKVFECIPNPTVVVFNAMIAGFSRLGTQTSQDVRLGALALFKEMLRRGMRPSKYTFKSAIEACNLTGSLECGKQIHARIITNDLTDDEFIGGALICLYSKFSLVGDSLRCFDTMRKQNIYSWASMISAYAENEQFEMALRLFNETLARGIRPDGFTLSSIMNAYGNFGMVRSCQQLQCYAIKAGLDRFTVCCNSQIYMYAKSGDLEAAINTFQDTSVVIDAASWSAIIFSRGLQGSASDALMLFEKMKECKITPNSSTFLAVLTACSHGGLIDEGFSNTANAGPKPGWKRWRVEISACLKEKSIITYVPHEFKEAASIQSISICLIRYFESMKMEYGLPPTASHFACIVDLFGHAGRLSEAEESISNSSFTNDPGIWKSLLVACEFHKDIERATRISDLLLKLNPFDAAPYMLMYNMYMGAGKMSSAMRTRGLMRERGVSREIAHCWIEIGASVHSFMASDTCHPESFSMHEKLGTMLINLKQKGGAACATIKALHLEYNSKNWKENILKSHCEMLAVAFGMIHLPKPASIRVMSNVRVSGDSHTILKLLSEIEGREIILRNPRRFHHFRWGSCSCGDYW